MTRIVFALLAFFVAAPVFAQTATVNSKLAWEELGQTPTYAQGAIYNLYVDGANVALNLRNVVCQTAPVVTDATCVASFPVLPSGSHSLVLTQVVSGTESGKSVVVTVLVIQVVVTPTNVRVIG